MMKRLSPSRYASPPHHDHTALAWLGQDVCGANVLATARLHLQIQTALLPLLPPGLHGVCRVAQWGNQRLRLAVPNTAYATKLRQILPRLMHGLHQAGWNLNEITIKIQMDLPGLDAGTKRPSKTVIPLDNYALEAFKHLHTQLGAGPLANAVTALLKHHCAPQNG